MEEETNASPKEETSEKTGKIQVTLSSNDFFFMFLPKFFRQFAILKNKRSTVSQFLSIDVG